MFIHLFIYLNIGKNDKSCYVQYYSCQFLSGCSVTYNGVHKLFNFMAVTIDWLWKSLSNRCIRAWIMLCPPWLYGMCAHFVWSIFPALLPISYLYFSESCQVDAWHIWTCGFWISSSFPVIHLLHCWQCAGRSWCWPHSVTICLHLPIYPLPQTWSIGPYPT